MTKKVQKNKMIYQKTIKKLQVSYMELLLKTIIKYKKFKTDFELKKLKYKLFSIYLRKFINYIN